MKTKTEKWIAIAYLIITIAWIIYLIFYNRPISIESCFLSIYGFIFGVYICENICIREKIETPIGISKFKSIKIGRIIIVKGLQTEYAEEKEERRNRKKATILSLISKLSLSLCFIMVLILTIIHKSYIGMFSCFIAILPVLYSTIESYNLRKKYFQEKNVEKI